MASPASRLSTTIFIRCPHASLSRTRPSTHLPKVVCNAGLELKWSWLSRQGAALLEMCLNGSDRSVCIAVSFIAPNACGRSWSSRSKPPNGEMGKNLGHLGFRAVDGTAD